MKATGIVRKIDALGRVVIPKEMRDKMFIEDGDPLEIYVQDESIIIKKFAAVCIFCGARENLSEFRGRPICSACAEAAKQEL